MIASSVSSVGLPPSPGALYSAARDRPVCFCRSDIPRARATSLSATRINSASSSRKPPPDIRRSSLRYRDIRLHPGVSVRFCQPSKLHPSSPVPFPTPPFQGRGSKGGTAANRLDAGKWLCRASWAMPRHHPNPVSGKQFPELFRSCRGMIDLILLKRRGLQQPPIVRWRSDGKGRQQPGITLILNSSPSLAKASLAVVLLVRCLHQSGQRVPRHWDVPRYRFHYHWTGPRESRA